MVDEYKNAAFEMVYDAKPRVLQTGKSIANP